VLQVVGVVRDIRYRSVGVDGTPFVYLPFRQSAMPQTMLLVRSRGSSLARSLRQIVAELSPGVPAVSIRRLDEAMAVGLAPQRIVAIVAGGLGLIGVLLAAIGIYGVTALTVSRRTREIAVRAALGAQRSAIIHVVLGQVLSLTARGIVLGIALGVIAGQVLSMFLVGVSPLDPLALIGAVGLTATVALVASWVPVRRAIAIAASDALRSE
jgi:ABC-type antimicrobial peptide transport system permease subunit